MQNYIDDPRKKLAPALLMTPSNVMLLREDLRTAFDQLKFVLVPKSISKWGFHCGHSSACGFIGAMLSKHRAYIPWMEYPANPVFACWSSFLDFLETSRHLKRYAHITWGIE